MSALGPGLALEGTVTTHEDLTIEGRVRGTIVAKTAPLTIGPHARVAADVHGQRVVVDGTLTGSIVATERIELTASAVVAGSLSAPRVVLADGARFTGSIDMARRTVDARLASYRDRIGADDR
jgi:cytoskeletal protein CcmA (bactofilin family)